MLKTVRTLAHQCPTCLIIHDSTSSSSEQAQPEPGNTTICIQCGEICVFEEDFKLRKMTGSELELMQQVTPLSYKMVQSVSEYIKSRKTL